MLQLAVRIAWVCDLKVWIGLLGGADALVRGRPPGRPFFLGEKIGVLAEQSGLALYRRRLSHDYETDQPVFLTWRLHDSLPCHRAFPAATLNSGQAFAAMDRSG